MEGAFGLQRRPVPSWKMFVERIADRETRIIEIRLIGQRAVARVGLGSELEVLLPTRPKRRASAELVFLGRPKANKFFFL
jgi:hypothetical protein